MEEPEHQQTCVDCKAQSPKTNTNFTLISARFGWRLRRERLPDNRVVIEWRCPGCWQKFKSARASGG